ncbi:hypothetical protein ACFE04_001001 [Oxalis oulophora]
MVIKYFDLIGAWTILWMFRLLGGSTIIHLLFIVYLADKLLYSIRILLESDVHNCDNFQVKKEDIEKIIDWEKSAPKQVEISFKPARDFTGVSPVVDLAVMRDPMNNLGSDSNKINPLTVSWEKETSTRFYSKRSLCYLTLS